MNRTDLTTTRAALQRQLDALAPIAMTCMTCAHLTQAGICDLFDERPPEHALATDIECPSWEYDGVPF